MLVHTRRLCSSALPKRHCSSPPTWTPKKTHSEMVAEATKRVKHISAEELQQVHLIYQVVTILEDGVREISNSGYPGQERD
jgi:hypothetical protein